MTFQVLANKRNRGITLIETLLYIALFGIILTAFLTSAYPLITGADRLSLHVLTEGEAGFVMRKISSILLTSQIFDIDDTGNVLFVDRSSGPSAYVRQGVTTPGSIEYSTDGTTYYPLTATRVVFSNFTVTYTAPSTNEAPHQVTISFDGGGETYTKTYHVFY